MSKKLIWGAVILLVILHKDFWWWESKEIVFGFLPIGLAYHAGVSICASILWGLAVVYAWPDDLEAEVEGDKS